MKRYSYSVCLAFVVLALLGLSRPVLAEERPFQLQRGQIYPSLFSNSDTLALVQIFGEITQLGQTGGGGLVSFIDVGVDGAFHARGIIGFVAANGDRLYATFVGSGFLDFYFEWIDGLEGTLTFVGGTGRFADASGSADLVYLRGRSSIEGAIDY